MKDLKMLNIKKEHVYFACVAMFIAGCAAPAEVENMVSTQSQKARSTSSFYKALSIKDVQGGSETNPMWVSQVSNDDFKSALKQSLKNTDYLAETKAQYNLQVQMVKIEQPLFGFNMTVPSSIKYIIKDEKEKVIFDHVVDAKFTATVGDAFAGIKRVRLANEGSIRENIKIFIEKLNSCS